MGFLQSGSIDIFAIFGGHISGFYEDIQFLGLPYLFNNHSHYNAAKDSSLVQNILNGIEEKTNLEVLGILSDYNGFAIASLKPINSLEDCKGVKIRVMQNPLYVAIYNNLGSQSTATDRGELYTSLQTGLVEANDLAVKSNYDSNCKEVVKAFAITPHFVWTQFIVI